MPNYKHIDKKTVIDTSIWCSVPENWNWGSGKSKYAITI